MNEITVSDAANNLIEELWNCSNGNLQNEQLLQKLKSFSEAVHKNNNLFWNIKDLNEEIENVNQQIENLNQQINELNSSNSSGNQTDNNNIEELYTLSNKLTFQRVSLLGKKENLKIQNENLNSFLQAENLNKIFPLILEIHSNNSFSNTNNLEYLYSYCSDTNRITLSFLILKYCPNYLLNHNVQFPLNSIKSQLKTNILNKISNKKYFLFKNKYLTYILIFIKEKLYEDEFLKSIGLDSKQINENRNYDTKQMRAKIQKSFYLIQNPILLYMIADYLCNYIFFTDEQVEYIKNEFKKSNNYKLDLTYLKINYSNIEPNYFQAGLSIFFNPVTQASVSLSSLSIMVAVLLNLTLGPR